MCVCVCVCVCVGDGEGLQSWCLVEGICKDSPCLALPPPTVHLFDYVPVSPSLLTLECGHFSSGFFQSYFYILPRNQSASYFTVDLHYASF